MMQLNIVHVDGLGSEFEGVVLAFGTMTICSAVIMDR